MSAQTLAGAGPSHAAPAGPPFLRVAGAGVRALRRLRGRCQALIAALRDPRCRENEIARRVSLGRAVIGPRAMIRDGAALCGNVTVAPHAILGEGSVLKSGPGEIRIGRYSQIGPDVVVLGANHPMDRLTTYTGSRLFEGRQHRFIRESLTEIGADVWIGYSAIILPGVTIGDGAVIGAGAVVTRDVAPYAVAAGNPAREIRCRFDEETVALLLAWRWWEREPEELLPYESLFALDLHAEREEGLRRLREVVYVSTT